MRRRPRLKRPKRPAFILPATNCRLVPSSAVSEGDLITVGELTLQVWETPGHAEGHLSFWMQGSDRTYLIGADLVFFDGKILLQSTHDCSISADGRSVAKVAALDFDALLPGHQQISFPKARGMWSRRWRWSK